MQDIYSRLYWFHAFGRHTAAEKLDIQYFLNVLKNGPTPNPDKSCTTRRNEQELSIPEPHVYAYIGRTYEAFGQACFVLPIDSLDGTISPFDTGGLVGHHKPTCTWQPDQRIKLLGQFSFDTSKLKRCLAEYPGVQPEQIASYLDGKGPSQSGPHEIWTCDLASLPAPPDIWKNTDDCRAWTWEGRATKIPTGQKIEAWTSGSTVYEGIVRYTEDAPEQELEWLAELLSKYRKGGVAELVEIYRTGKGGEA